LAVDKDIATIDRLTFWSTAHMAYGIPASVDDRKI